MRFAVLGTGTVGRTISGKLLELGHEVTMGSRRADHPEGIAWAAAAGERAHLATFAGAAASGEIVVNATLGMATLEVLAAAGADNLAGKILVDLSNPLDFSAGFPPTLAVANDDSLGERIQAAFPQTRVVKTLNTMSAPVMVAPALVPGHHTVFISGNDPAARIEVAALLGTFGWPAEDIVQLGDISTCRGPEMYMPLWLRLFGVVGTAHFNIQVSRP